MQVMGVCGHFFNYDPTFSDPGDLASIMTRSSRGGTAGHQSGGGGSARHQPHVMQPVVDQSLPSTHTKGGD